MLAPEKNWWKPMGRMEKAGSLLHLFGASFLRS